MIHVTKSNCFDDAPTGDDGGPASEMTVLDEFAKAALGGLIARASYSPLRIAGERAYDIAEMMIAEKRRREGGK